MYHIKSDKRSQASAAQIVRGLEECLKTTPLKSVTVSDIHRVTGISRATFYRLFDTPEDVIHYQFSKMAEAAVENNGEDWSRKPDKLLESTIRLGMQNNDFLKAVVANGRFDLLYQYTEQNFRILDERWGIVPKEMHAIEREYLLSHLSMSMVATLITWSKNGRRESPAEVVSYMKTHLRFLRSLIGD